mmetsp:Transcript_20511/g.57771  ORF Transcript_20511/g.57771 Transcript_20511/m.57771 type:complete len:328 (+) Transcript_20511:214-1197(+)|eukprot:CAMPEP_0119119130 /NCGR_PEP_ID=MMETSP1310-20130426/756_1 /TAXON_ID=464262 /ORGANISM="Genus nov. species nov., Strain RCC2339" /LENGTH=327 /DNA_ID=CAMNT_0007108547 /DNA_START=210 /DNA_END=1193 /DNA_ORIENTATION=-
MKGTFVAVCVVVVGVSVACGVVVRVVDGHIDMSGKETWGQQHKSEMLVGDHYVGMKMARSPEEVRAFWTSERMKSAIPLDMELEEGDGAERENPRVTRGSCSPNYDQKENTTFYNRTPGVAVGKVFFRQGLFNTAYVCSGSVTKDNYVMTAGHCVYDPLTGFSTDFLFVPGYYEGEEPRGSYAAVNLYTTSGWGLYGMFTWDYAIAELESNVEEVAKGKNFPLVVNLDAGSTVYRSYGYAADRPYDGETVHQCTSEGCVIDLIYSTIGIYCDQTGGASGGPWLIPGKTDSLFFIAGVNSYHYNGPHIYLYSPYFNSDTQDFYDAIVK